MTEPADFSRDERFRKAERLLDRSDFLKTRREGRRNQTEHFVVYARPNDRSHARLGVTASTRVGKATVRNWWKRRIREIFRRNKLAFPAGFDYVVIVRAEGGRAPFEVLREELLEALDRAPATEE
ncbi:MAG: ribonuclease P protein component [Bradymonadaceae bacterium]